MSFGTAKKRSRQTYEANLQTEQSPYVIYGTPLPPQDPDIRDDGSYVPVWKQEVRDERGLKRLHGAFTGGFSAGYFNTVGSKEGWTPSTFSSSRSDRKNGIASKFGPQRPEDFMDEEDIRDAEDARKVETAAGFSGLGSTVDDSVRKGALIDLFRPDGETIGVKLLRKMGWKEGQGIGPKVRRTARLSDNEGLDDEYSTTHLFAPENTTMIKFIKKNDFKGLGFEEVRHQLNQEVRPGLGQHAEDDNEDWESPGPLKMKKKKPVNSGFGVGILNDTGSDDEDPYEVGPRISYNRFMGGERKKEPKKKKPVNRVLNPLVSSKPVYFSSKKASLAKTNAGLRKCSNGCLPIEGFILSQEDDTFSVQEAIKRYEPPKIPEGWKSSKQTSSCTTTSQYLSLSDAAKVSKLDPKLRASILGEPTLPGKSVFDFLSPAARDRLVAASGNDNLPAALGLVPKEYSMTKEERQKELFSQIPVVDKLTADAALSRGESGFMPYGDDEAKRNRYRAYLEYQSETSKVPPSKASNVSDTDWLKELHEFASCAQIFKPMTGSMATRFTSSSNQTSQIASSSLNTSTNLLSKPKTKPEDPAMQAASLSMYGPLTRSAKDWYPTRLLCKRFNIYPPANIQPSTVEKTDEDLSRNLAPELVSKGRLDAMMRDSFVYQQENTPVGNKKEAEDIERYAQVEEKKLVVDIGKNEALEGQRAGEAVFKAIFGDDSDDDV